MDKDSAQETRPRRAAAPRRLRDSDRRMPPPPPPPPTEDTRPRRTKRKASPDTTTPRKRRRVSESRKNPEEGVLEKTEEPPKKINKKRRLLKADSSDPLEGCSSNMDERPRRDAKRKAAAATDAQEEPDRKRRRSEEEVPKQAPREKLSVAERRAQFELKYKQQNLLGEGGCGSVYAGYRISDNLPVAIKHVASDKVFIKHKDRSGNELSMEVAVMLKLLKASNGQAGRSAAISLLDWYDLDQELILVMERPVPSMDLHKYIEEKGGKLREEEAKIILKQLVDAMLELQRNHVFHRDIKVENILIETSSDVPRVRLIDFGLSCFVKKRSLFSRFCGTLQHTPPEWYVLCRYGPEPTTVWQLGVVLFESLHNQELFETTKFVGKKLKINRKLSNECRDFLRKCLTINPKDRVTLQELQQHPWLR